MPLAFRFDGSVDEMLSFGGKFVILCDQCGKEIVQDGSHNVEVERGTGGEIAPVKFLHFSCSDAARSSGGKRPVWMKLKRLHLETK